MVGCSVLGCKSRSERKIAGITFHSYPSDPKLKLQWVKATGRSNWEPTKNTKMCSIHFSEESFICKKKLVMLHAETVPTKHVHIENLECFSFNILQELQNNETNLCKVTHSRDSFMMEVPGPSTSMSTSTPKKEKELKHLLLGEKARSATLIKKLRAVRESKRRLLKKIASLGNIIADLKVKMKMGSEELDLLSNIDTENADFLKRYIDKENCPKMYSPSLRKFALSLNFLSSNAYIFVRKRFNTCLPHPKTLYRWYSCVNCEPGSTNESFKVIKLLVNKTNEKVLCCLSLDEMSIRQHLQWNGKKTVGYVNIGDNLESDNLPYNHIPIRVVMFLSYQIKDIFP